jgi:hypothetical protein
MSASDRKIFLTESAKPRLARLASLCHALAKPYSDFYKADLPFDWYKSY